MTSIGTAILKRLNTFSDKPLLISIRRGLTLMIPLLIIGAFAVFINNIPIPAYQHYMTGLFGENWKNFGGYVQLGTFSIMAVGMVLTISYSAASISPLALKHEVNPMIASIVSLACLFTILHVENGYISFSWLGPLGVFVSILTACISVYLFLWLSSFSRLKIRVYSNAADASITQAMASLLPALLTISCFAGFHVIMAFLGFHDIYASLNNAVKHIFMNRSADLSTAIIFVIFIHLGWFFGIHGNNALEQVTQSLFTPALAVNQQLAAQGLPPVEIFTKQFFDVYVFLGGSGATLCLIAAVLLRTRRANTKQIAQISLLPALINVNEPVIFGIPIVLNFYLLIPFVALPVILTIITYAAMSWGMVPLTSAPVEWTTPILLGGYLTSGSLAGSLLQFFNFIVGMIIYLPFIRLYEKQMAHGEEETMHKLLKAVVHRHETKEATLLNQPDAVGHLARLLARDLERDLRDEKIRLEYQPQVNALDGVIGVEALLRWTHDYYGPVAPPIAVALAEETGLIHDLGKWIIKTACEQLKTWNNDGLNDLVMSINITPVQLDDRSLKNGIRQILKETGLNPRQIELEITEQAALGGFIRIERLHELKSLGLRLAMDDFGMGHGSLLYLKEFNLDTIKIDGALVRDVLTNDKCGEIINAIIKLSQSMGIRVIAEYVENEEQRNTLFELGCYDYQGFLYSPSIPPEYLKEFYQQKPIRQSLQ